MENTSGVWSILKIGPSARVVVLVKSFLVCMYIQNDPAHSLLGCETPSKIEEVNGSEFGLSQGGR